MSAVVAGVCVAMVTFGGGLTGFALHRLLPERATAGALRDMTGAIGGLLSLLTALVLGLLIWTAYGVYAGQVTAVRGLATHFLELDLALTDFGPEAAGARAQLRDDVAKVVSEIWGGDQNYASRNYGAAIANWHARQTSLRALTPVSEPQKQALAAALQSAKDIAQTRLQMAVALNDTVSLPLVVVVVGWAVLIFVGYGLMHTGTLDSLSAMAVGAAAVATAVFLLIDLSHPYTGLVQVSPEPILGVLTMLGK